jgi:hypothetical protein
VDPLRVKYPRTLHVPWSEGISNDDRVASSVPFEGRRVIVTEKMDGECTTIYSDGFYHARSIDSGFAPWRSRVAALASQLSVFLPAGWRVCGENVWAKHSIEYNDLPDLFLWFSVWDGDWCLPWDESETWMEMLSVRGVSKIYTGLYDERAIKLSFEKYVSSKKREVEGYVIRLHDGFQLADFQSSVLKWVRRDHVKTDERWEKNWTSNKTEDR